MPDDQPIHAGLLAQFTGHLSIAAALRAHAGIGQDQAHVTLSTAINAISLSLHADIRADRWMLYHHRSTFAGDGMTHAECRVYDQGGSLVASFTVDAMVRGFADPSKADARDRAVSLTTGRGPLGTDPAGWFSKTVPAGVTFVEPHARRVQGVVDGTAVIDTERALLVHRAGQTLSFAFPADEVGGLPSEPEMEAPGYVRVPWDAVDAWYEEGRKLVHYPPNPYHRVDCRPTTRHLKVEVAGVTLVDTDDTIILFETSLAPKLYVAPGAGAHRSAAPDRDDHLLQLQGRVDVLVGGDRRHRGRGRRLELRGPAARESPDQGISQLRLEEGRRRRRAPRVPRRSRGLRLFVGLAAALFYIDVNIIYPWLMTAFGTLLLDRADDDRPALLYEDRRWTYRELVREGWRRAALFAELRDPDRPPHVGVLLDNVPDYLFWLTAGALSGTVVVGINSTYRGEQLAQLIDHTDCQALVTSSDLAGLLDGAAHTVPSERVLVVDEPGYAARLDAARPIENEVPAPSDDDLFLLIFTSGSTGLPKAVRCTQGRIGRTGAHVASIAELTLDDVVYAPLPFFHAASLFTGWASAVHAGVPISMRKRFSASGTVPDIRAFGATFLTYTGKVLNYLLSVPEAADDADVPLRLAIGNEASEHDIREFARRFDCQVRDSYGSTEGVIIIRRDATMPAGALGTANDSVKVLDPETGHECPRAVFDDNRRVVNLDEAVGEIVETEPTSGFEGYYRNTAATSERFRDGAYWSGDLAYRDADGWLYFAGRSNDWLRVDGENFAAGPVEAIIARHADVRSVAVYAVPDDPVGDRVMVALELRDGPTFDPAAFDEFLHRQPDLGPKWLPAFVRVDAELPKLSSMKVNKKALRSDAWRVDGVVWRPSRNDDLRPLTADDRRALAHLLPDGPSAPEPGHVPAPDPPVA